MFERDADSRAPPAPSSSRSADDVVERGEELRLGGRRASALSIVRPIGAVARDEPGEDLRPAEVDADDAVCAHAAAATIPGRMPDGEKPYRVYEGGRVKGQGPARSAGRRRRRAAALRRGDGPDAGRARRRYGRWLALALLTLVAFVLVWARRELLLLSQRRRGRERPGAAERRGASLTEQSGLLTSHPTTILLLGTDGGTRPARAQARAAPTRSC